MEQYDDGLGSASNNASSIILDDENDGTDYLGTAKTSFVRKLFELVFQEPDDVVGFLADGSSFEVPTHRISRIRAEICL
jgi:hypothetical protein